MASKEAAFRDALGTHLKRGSDVLTSEQLGAWVIIYKATRKTHPFAAIMLSNTFVTSTGDTRKQAAHVAVAKAKMGRKRIPEALQRACDVLVSQ
jgi:ribosomal protein S11